MPLPLSFTGTLRGLGGASSADELSNRIASALASEGGSDIRATDHRLSFRGLTDYLSLSPLTNITEGVIELHERSSLVDLAYAIRVNRKPFVVSSLIGLIGLAFVAAGVAQFGFLAVFGFGALVYSTAWSFVMRFRLHRWLRRIGEQPASDST